jgi:hypothetical protein
MAPEHSFSLCSSEGHKVTSPEPPEKKYVHLDLRKNFLHLNSH